jgi:hypothetical protein
VRSWLRRFRWLHALAFLQFCAAAWSLPVNVDRTVTFVLAGVVLLLVDEDVQVRRRVARLEYLVLDLDRDRDEETDRP